MSGQGEYALSLPTSFWSGTGGALIAALIALVVLFTQRALDRASESRRVHRSAISALIPAVQSLQDAVLTRSADTIDRGLSEYSKALALHREDVQGVYLRDSLSIPANTVRLFRDYLTDGTAVDSYYEQEVSESLHSYVYWLSQARHGENWLWLPASPRPDDPRAGFDPSRRGDKPRADSIAGEEWSKVLRRWRRQKARDRWVVRKDQLKRSKPEGD